MEQLELLTEDKVPGTKRKYDASPVLALTVGPFRGGWSEGVFVGDHELVAWAKAAAEVGLEVELLNMNIICDVTSARGALGALGSRWPGRIIITDAPNELLEEISLARGSLEFGERPMVFDIFAEDIVLAEGEF